MMNAPGKWSLMLLAATSLLGAAAYGISCRNAGHRLTWKEFTDGAIRHSTSNCGGNAVANYECLQLSATAFNGEQAVDGRRIGILKDQEALTTALTDISSLMADVKFLALTNAFEISPNNNEIILVCNTPFDNVPAPGFWNLHRRSRRHAVGRANFQTGFISEAEFAALDRSQFAVLEPKRIKELPRAPQTNRFE